jgi:hypothetical protein
MTTVCPHRTVRAAPAILGCQPPKPGKPRTLESLVAEFRTRYPRSSDSETKMFRAMPSDELAIHHAATARDEGGRCFDHAGTRPCAPPSHTRRASCRRRISRPPCAH